MHLTSLVEPVNVVETVYNTLFTQTAETDCVYLSISKSSQASRTSRDFCVATPALNPSPLPAPCENRRRSVQLTCARSSLPSHHLIPDNLGPVMPLLLPVRRSFAPDSPFLVFLFSHSFSSLFPLPFPHPHPLTLLLSILWCVPWVQYFILAQLQCSSVCVCSVDMYACVN